MKVIWELDNWKKNEESKFLIEMKQKEIDYVNKLVDKWKIFEADKEKAFKQHELDILEVEKNLKVKLAELQRRENKIVQVENELRSRINSVSNELVLKDREIERLRDDSEIRIQKLIKEKKTLDKKNKVLVADLERKEEELREFKAGLDEHPIGKLKAEIAEKDGVIDDLNKDIEKYEELKNEYVLYTNQLSDTNVKLKRELEKHKNKDNHELVTEINKLKLKLLDLDRRGDNAGLGLSSIKQELRQYKENNTNLNDKEVNRELTYSEVSKLEREKDYLLSIGLEKNDPMIRDVESRIMNLKG